MDPIKTGNHKEKGDRAGVKTAAAAGAGALVGGLANSDNEDQQEEHEVKGAVVGAGLSGLKKEEDLVVAAGDLLQFDLEAPLTIDETK